jgi:tetratricopeptide (TPR) repeat protein
VWGNNKNFRITDNDKDWVHETFEWLLKTYGYPARHYKTILFTEEFFPDSLAHKQTAIEPLLIDICRQLGIKREKIVFEIETDIRDTFGTPYQFEEKAFESELVADTGQEPSYKIYIASFLFKNPGRLLFNCICQCIKIRMLESGIENANDEDVALLIILAGIYWGYGVLLAQTITNKGRYADGGWEIKWNNGEDIPIPVMAYALALYYSLLDEKDPSLKRLLPADMQNEYEKATLFINKSPNPFYSRQELAANDLFNAGSISYEKNDFDSAIESFQKALFLAEQDRLKADLYNFIGYAWLRKEEYLKSIPNFQKALEIIPQYGYANDNLGFAFIMHGDADSGRYYMDVAIGTKNNDPGFSHRNLALYHQKRGELQLAEDNFQKAFVSDGFRVDLLEYFYGRFLLEKGEKEKAIKYLNISVDKGEPEAINFMKTISSI